MADDSKAGEIDKILEDIKSESKLIMEDLMEVDNILSSLKDKVEMDETSKESILKEIEAVRLRIGVLEKEDVQEEEYEEMADSLIKKLRKWVDYVA